MSAALVVIAGPTAAGKTALALELAQALPIEIISADSRQVYRGLDIGTAKPTPEERASVAHHLIDVVDPDHTFDAAQFADLAREAIAAITARQRLPVVVGGTGLYLRALLGGLSPLPGRDDALRERLWQERLQLGPEAQHRQLAERDPDSAARIEVADGVRVIRALEVLALTGRSLSAWHREHAFNDRPYRTLWWVVDRAPAELTQRIEERARRMFAAGLIEEAVSLRARFGPSALLGTLGYREALAVADGELERPQAIAQTAVRTRRYAKRQRTWLRKEPVDRWETSPTCAQLRHTIEAWR